MNERKKNENTQISITFIDNEEKNINKLSLEMILSDGFKITNDYQLNYIESLIKNNDERKTQLELDIGELEKKFECEREAFDQKKEKFKDKKEVSLKLGKSLYSKRIITQ